MSSEPRIWSASLRRRLPSACLGKTTCLMPITTNGKITPVSRARRSTTVRVARRSWATWLHRASPPVSGGSSVLDPLVMLATIRWRTQRSVNNPDIRLNTDSTVVTSKKVRCQANAPYWDIKVPFGTTIRRRLALARPVPPRPSYPPCDSTRSASALSSGSGSRPAESLPA